MRKVLLILLACLISSYVVVDPEAPVYGTVKGLMSKQAQKRTGVASLSLQEKQALDAWISALIIRTINRTSPYEYDPEVNHIELLEFMAEIQSDSGTSGFKPRSVHWVDSVFEDGALVLLGDGSLWGVARPDRFRTAKWLPGERVVIGHTGKTYFAYSLRNLSSGGGALVSLQAPASWLVDTANAPKKVAGRSYFEFVGLNKDGHVLLDDNSSYEVSVSSGSIVRRWLPGDNIVLEKGHSSVYPLLLHNVDTGGKAKARENK